MEIYYGDVPLCYTNSLAMTLSAYGYELYPEYLEALMAMGNGAFFMNQDAQHPIVFFDNGLPDRSISHT
ncbi:DNA repair protein RadC, partial [Streptococcus pyogenes]